MAASNGVNAALEALARAAIPLGLRSIVASPASAAASAPAFAASVAGPRPITPRSSSGSSASWEAVAARLNAETGFSRPGAA